MLENFVTIVRNQYDASLSTLQRCLRTCTDEQWKAPLANLTFSQAAFHAVFYADMYLHATHDDSFRRQPFHLANTDAFGDYEELQDRKQRNHYQKSFVAAYLDHCRAKVRAELDKATAAWLQEPSPFPWIQSTRSEVHLYNIGTSNITQPNSC